MGLDVADWKNLEKDLSNQDLQFIGNILDGMDIVAAYVNQHPGGSRAEALARFAWLYGKYEPIFARCKDRIGAICEMLTLDDTRQLLSSHDPRQQDKGIKHTRAIRGMDAPARQDVRINPHLDERELEPG